MVGPQGEGNAWQTYEIITYGYSGINPLSPLGGRGLG